MSQDSPQNKDLKARCRETEQENARLAVELRRAQEQLNNILDNISDVYYEVSLEGEILYVSPSVETLSEGQYTREDLIGMSISEIYVNPRDREKVLESLMRDGNLVDYELLFKNRDGSLFPVSVSSKILFDENQQPTAIAGTMRDIRERKQDSESLLRSMSLLEKAEELNVAGAWEIDFRTNEPTVSDNWARILGLENRHPDWETFQKLVHPDDVAKVSKAFDDALEENKPYELEHRILRASDGVELHIQCRGEVVRDADGTPLKFIGVSRDITEQARVREVLFQQSRYHAFISEMSNRLLTSLVENIDEAIDQCLESIGEFCDVDRVYIFQCDENFQTASNSHEWCRDGINPEIENLQDLTFRELLPVFAGILQSGQTVCVPRVGDMRSEMKPEHEFLKAQDIQSLLVVPMRSHEGVIGFMGFDSVNRERIWTEHEQHLLEVTGQSCAHLLTKKFADEKIQKSEALLNETGRVASIGGWEMDAETLAISWTQGLREILEVPDDFEPTIENSMELYTPESKLIIDDAMKRCLLENDDVDIELTIHTYTGRLIWVHVVGRAIIEDGKCVRIQGVFQDVTDQKNAERSIEKRILAVSGAGDDAAQINFDDLFNLEDIQKLQDEFCEATGVASIMTYPDGTPITKPTNFCRLCNDIIRKTEKGLANCMHSDATLGRHHSEGPIVQPCLSGGLWDAGASITVAGRHIASWLIGQVRDETQSEEKMLEYAEEIGADKRTFLEAFREVPSMSEKKFRKVSDLLFTLANQISFAAYQNLQQTRYIVEQEKAQCEMERYAVRQTALLNILQYETDSLQGFLDHALNQSIELTESKIGYIYFYDNEKRQFILNSWSKDVMKECDVVEPQTCCDLDKTGIWGEAVRQQKPIMLNNFQSEHPLKKGLPAGHVQLEKYLTVPIRSGGKIVAVIGVANKETDYDDVDVMQLTLLMDSVWKTVENVRSETALKENERYLRSILQTTMDGFVVLDGTGCLCDANDAYCKMSGYSRGELIGKHISELDADESPEDSREHIRQISEKGHAVFEARHRRKDGTTLETESTVSALKDGSARLMAFVRDISDRKKAQEELRRSEEQYRLIAENTVDCIWMADMELNLLYVNQAVENVFGYSPQEVIGTNLLKYCDDDKVRDIMGVIAKKLEGHPEMAEAEFEASFYDKDGNSVPVEIHGAIIIDEKGQAKALQGVTRDITERKKAQAALRQSEERFRILLEDITMVSVQGYAPDGTAMYWNKGSEQLYGYSREEAIGKNLLDLIIPVEMHDGVRQAMREMAETGVAIPASEMRLMHKDGSGVDVFSCHSILQRPGREQELYCVDIDLTQIKEGEAQREHLQEQLTQAQKMESVGRLAGGVAHDFNNMLNVIIGHAEMLLEDVGEDSPFQESLKQIRQAGKRSADLTRQLLAFARKQTISLKNMDINDSISSMLSMLKRLIGEDIRLVWKPGTRLEEVRMDPIQLDQILANLIVNARDAIKDVGSIIIETEPAEFDEEYCEQHPGAIPGHYSLVVVSDDGSGMDSDTIERVFEPFFTTKSVGEGTGLGLSTVYGIIKQNNGFINVYSEPGRGTTFRIYLPVARQKQSALNDTAEKETAVHDSGQETILMVEDERSVLGLGRSLLERAGYNVLAAASPNEAIQIARGHPGNIDLLLTDVIMPEMNGRDMALKIMRLYPEIKCVFMSGYTANVIAHQGVLDEGVNFLQKPFNSRSLQEAVRRALDK